MPKTCPWCASPDAADDPDPTTLCRMHEAEHDGLSLSGLEHRDAEQGAEYTEWALGR